MREDCPSKEKRPPTRRRTVASRSRQYLSKSDAQQKQDPESNEDVVMTEATDADIKATSDEEGFTKVTYKHYQPKTNHNTRRRGGRRTRRELSNSSGGDGFRAGQPRRRTTQETLTETREQRVATPSQRIAEDNRGATRVPASEKGKQIVQDVPQMRSEAGPSGVGNVEMWNDATRP